MYDRILEAEVIRLASFFHVIAITGPRQSGKTTLCRKIYPQYEYINLEDETTRYDVEFSRKEYLIQHRQGLIIDEVQNMPEIFSAVQVVVDSFPDARFVLTGSNNFLLMQKITQSLAGRVAVLTLLPFSLQELKDEEKKKSHFELMFNGFYPVVWSNEIPPTDVYRQYFSTYIQRDVQQVLRIRQQSEFRRFVIICASRVGTEFNANSISSELGVSVPTIIEWLNVLEASYIVFRLQPFYRNINKRLVKTPKIYFYDVGLVCFLLGIKSAEQVEMHPLRGQIFENMIVCEFIKDRYNHGQETNLYFFKDRSREVDLIQENEDGLYAYEIKMAGQIHPDFYKNLYYFRSLFPEEVKSTQVINTGEDEKDDADSGHLNFRRLPTSM